jgi:hypothetical protein
VDIHHRRRHHCRRRHFRRRKRNPFSTSLAAAVDIHDCLYVCIGDGSGGGGGGGGGGYT